METSTVENRGGNRGQNRGDRKTGDRRNVFWFSPKKSDSVPSVPGFSVKAIDGAGGGRAVSVRLPRFSLVSVSGGSGVDCLTVSAPPFSVMGRFQPLPVNSSAPPFWRTSTGPACAKIPVSGRKLVLVSFQVNSIQRPPSWAEKTAR